MKLNKNKDKKKNNKKESTTKSGFFGKIFKTVSVTAVISAVTYLLSSDKAKEKISDGASQIKGSFDKGVGMVKEGVGRFIEDDELEFAGKMQRAKGDVRMAGYDVFDDIEEDTEDAFEKFDQVIDNANQRTAR